MAQEEMKLYATVTNSRGKKEGQGDNEYLEVLLSEKNENRFLIAFNGKRIKILNYSIGEWTELEQAKKQKGEKCSYCKEYPCSLHDGSKYE